MGTNEIRLFSRRKDDFHFKIQSEKGESRFDRKLKAKWSKAEEENLFRYSVRDQQHKVLEGKFGFFAQLNVGRGTMRRAPEKIMSMSQPFDPKKFNFTEITHREILFDIGDGSGNDVIVINVSPILWSHCILVPQRLHYLPQEVTMHSLQKAIEVLLLSNSENMRVLFNSLCANASVNHLHWHFYYLDQRMLLEWINLKHFIDMIYVLEDFPSKAFCIKYSSFGESIGDFTSYAYRVVACLQKNDIAHNIYITRAKRDVNKKEFDDIRIYIWARTKSFGAKNTEDAFIIAACELFGHLPIRTEEAYETMNEDYVSTCLKEVTTEEFLNAQREFVKEFRDYVIEKNYPVYTFCAF